MKSGINESGNVFKTQDGRWKAQCQIGQTSDGKRKFKTKTFATKKEAAKWIELMRAEYDTPSPQAHTNSCTFERIEVLLESIANITK